MPTTISKHHGFTLVEISIVLVIIGLLVGGVLVGRDLIRASELRGLVSDVESLKSATNTFRIKYGQLPGDMLPSLAAQLGFFTFTGANAGIVFGNNNGRIEEQPLEWFCFEENSVLFRHLAEANLIRLGSQTPLNTEFITYFAGTPSDTTLLSKLDTYLMESRVPGTFFCASSLRYSLFTQTITSLDRNRNVFTLRGPAQTSHSSFIEPAISPIDYVKC